MFAFGICRLDAGAEGIHLAWNAPDVVCLSSPGFDIQRRVVLREVGFQCVVLTSKELVQLKAHHELSTALGPVLYRQSGPIPPLVSSPTSTPWPSATAMVDVFTLELASPTHSVRVSVTIAPSAPLKPFAAFAVASSGGKTVASGTALGDGTFLVLTGSRMDTVVVYTVSPLTVGICALPPEDPADPDWASVPYLIRGLTLPIHEADPSLTNAALEFAAAAGRLTGDETLSQADFNRLVDPLRPAVAQTGLGRPGERIVLGRTRIDDPYEEMTLADQLALLQTHPRFRRVLGFGYFDRASGGLVPGETYQYRIAGHFPAKDASGTVYDFHTIPSHSALPSTFFLADLRLSFPSPVSVVLDPAPPANALNAVSRRGIRITPKSVLPGWLGPSLDDWSVILDLPRAVSSIVLEADPFQKLEYAGGDPWAFSATSATAPPGSIVTLSFPSPVTEIRLRGRGILFAIRLPALSAAGIVPIVANTALIPFSAQPLPAPPLSLTVSNLQTPPGTAVFSNQASFQGPQRQPPGFQLVWLPAPTGGISLWPTGTTDAPPLDAIAFQIEHREVTLPATTGPWEPILPGDNLALGTRDNSRPAAQLALGANLADVFPMRRPRSAAAGLTVRLSDVFDLQDPGGVFQRPVPAFGTYHQYQIRAIDTVGRVSSNWTLSNVVRFEKHGAPPLPVGPQPEPDLVTNPDGTMRLGSPPGVKARALVVDDPSLTAADRAILGTHKNAIVLDWGWRDSERQTDPLTNEFRVYYLLNAPDVIPGNITSVAAASGGWNLGFQSSRTLNDGDSVGQWIISGGYPFRISSLTGGAHVIVHVDAALANPSATPVIGQAQFGRQLSPDHQRPASWDARATVVPLTSAESYRFVFYDLLNLSSAHPLDTLWVGVSAADAESYVDDEFPTALPNGGRPGNESSIVTCAVSARDHTRPVFSVPPPVGDVPEFITEEPTGRQVLVTLDLPSLLPGVLAPGEPIALDRCSIDTLLSITVLDAQSRVQLLFKDGTSQIVTFPNPSDEAAVVATLQSANPERMATRFLMFLATQHLRPNEIFERVAGNTLLFGPAQDRLAPKPARCFYRVRRADSLGRVSMGGAILPVVVRVPSIAPPIAPERVALASTPTSVAITLRVPRDEDLSCLLVFSTMLPLSSPITDLTGAELLRIPNRRDLYPHSGLRLRVPSSDALLTPVAKLLSDPDVVIDPAGNRSAMVSVPGTFGNYVILWTYALSKDGIPSRLTGPFTWGVPKS